MAEYPESVAGTQCIRVVHLSTYDVAGGAARAAYRLHKGLQRLGVDSHMAVQRRLSDDDSVSAPTGLVAKAMARFLSRTDPIPTGLYRQRTCTPFSVPWTPGSIRFGPNPGEPDVLHLHWIAGGFIGIGSLGAIRRRSLVWTLHDAWPFTGGCHYSQDCDRYTERCGSCPALGSARQYDLSRLIMEWKLRAWQNVRVTVVSPSNWLAACARRSSLFGSSRVTVIPNGLDTSRFRPVDKGLARQLLDLPPDRSVILYGAMNSTTDPRKGFDYLSIALRLLAGSRLDREFVVAVFGGPLSSESRVPEVPVRSLGYLRDDLALTVAYSAADVFVAPSRQDNLPNTVMEAAACGVPCVAFSVGGMPDLIEHRATGYLAEPGSPSDLAAGIRWVLEDEGRRESLSRAARAKVLQEFELGVVSQQYRALYESALEPGV